MAIIKMKRVSMIALKQDRDALLSKMQSIGCVQVTEMPQTLRDEGYGELELRAEIAGVEEKLAMLTAAIASLDRHAPLKKGLFPQLPEVDERDVAQIRERSDRLIADCRRILDGEAQLNDFRQRITRLEAQNAQLLPLEGLQVTLEDIADSRTTIAQIGRIPHAQLEAVQLACAENGLMEIIEVGRENEAMYVIALCHKSEQEAYQQLLTQCGFSRLTLQVNGTISGQIAANKGEIAAMNDERESVIKEIITYADRRDEMQLLYDLIGMDRDQLISAAQFAATEHAMHLSGWIPENRIEKLDKAIEEQGLTAVVEYADPEGGDDPPTCVQNNKFFTPYESVTDMFSSPGKDDIIDPTPQMMPFFVLFFGMMVSDAGYGFTIFLGALLVTWKLKLRGTMGAIAKVLIVGGLATAFWGILFGGWFGIEGIEAPLLSPMNQPIQMLGLCFGLGMVHIFYGMILRARIAFMQGDWQTAVFDEFAWIFLILGLIVWVAGPMIGPAWLGTVGMVTSIVCVLGILLFAGRDKKGIGRIVGGLGALYGITSYLSDILSYARLFAMGLATGVICMVFNTIAGLLMGNPVGFVFGIIILIVGHVFNLAINALGAYVHSCRLQYIEFFGKFYNGGGQLFSPLTIQTKYVTFKNN